jgi:D-alanyl-D-alanine carboxypeptidase
VKSLAGYVPLDGDDSVQFVLMMNASSVDEQSVFLPHWNDLAEVMALASVSPSASELAP